MISTGRTTSHGQGSDETKWRQCQRRRDYGKRSGPASCVVGYSLDKRANDKREMERRKMNTWRGCGGVFARGVKI